MRIDEENDKPSFGIYFGDVKIDIRYSQLAHDIFGSDEVSIDSVKEFISTWETNECLGNEELVLLDPKTVLKDWDPVLDGFSPIFLSKERKELKSHLGYENPDTRDEKRDPEHGSLEKHEVEDTNLLLNHLPVNRIKREYEDKLRKLEEVYHNLPVAQQTFMALKYFGFGDEKYAFDESRWDVDTDPGISPSEYYLRCARNHEYPWCGYGETDVNTSYTIATTHEMDLGFVRFGLNVDPEFYIEKMGARAPFRPVKPCSNYLKIREEVSFYVHHKQRGRVSKARAYNDIARAKRWIGITRTQRRRKWYGPVRSKKSVQHEIGDLFEHYEVPNDGFRNRVDTDAEFEYGDLTTDEVLQKLTGTEEMSDAIFKVLCENENDVVFICSQVGYTPKGQMRALLYETFDWNAFSTLVPIHEPCREVQISMWTAQTLRVVEPAEPIRMLNQYLSTFTGHSQGEVETINAFFEAELYDEAVMAYSDNKAEIDRVIRLYDGKLSDLARWRINEIAELGNFQDLQTPTYVHETIKYPVNRGQLIAINSKPAQFLREKTDWGPTFGRLYAERYVTLNCDFEIHAANAPYVVPHITRYNAMKLRVQEMELTKKNIDAFVIDFCKHKNGYEALEFENTLGVLFNWMADSEDRAFEHVDRERVTKIVAAALLYTFNFYRGFPENQVMKKTVSFMMHGDFLYTPWVTELRHFLNRSKSLMFTDFESEDEVFSEKIRWIGQMLGDYPYSVDVDCIKPIIDDWSTILVR